MFFNDKYRLDLKWEKTEYRDNTCVLHGAYFSGPVLQLAEKIEANNSMRLDFFKQYFILVSNVYIGNLSWKEVIYKEDRVYLLDCTLTHASELHKVPKLNDNDILIIDCKNHDREIHSFYPTYKTYVSNEDTQLYTFSG